MVWKWASVDRGLVVASSGSAAMALTTGSPSRPTAAASPAVAATPVPAPATTPAPIPTVPSMPANRPPLPSDFRFCSLAARLRSLATSGSSFRILFPSAFRACSSCFLARCSSFSAAFFAPCSCFSAALLTCSSCFCAASRACSSAFSTSERI